MPFHTVKDIQEAVKTKEEELLRLWNRMDNDFDLLTLKDYVPKGPSGKARQGYEGYTSSAPLNIFNKIMEGLNRASLSIQIKLPESATEEQRKAASLGELFLFGGLAAIDRALIKKRQPTLRTSVGHFICNRGWYSLRALVYVPKGEKETVFDVKPWDSRHVTSEDGANGLLWAAYTNVRSKGTIWSEYGIEIKGKTAQVTDWWDEETNSVIIDNEFGKTPTPHSIGHVPVLIGPVGSMPTMQGKDYLSAIEFQGESVWAASRKLYEMKNKYTSWVMDVAKKAVAGSLVHYSQDGTKKIEGDPFETFKVIPAVFGKELIDPLKLPQMAPEAAAALATIDRDLQESTLPSPFAYGGTDQPLSGRALSILADATRSVFSPRTEAMARVYTWLCEELLAQFATKKGIKPSELTGFDASNEFFQVTVKPKEVNTNWFLSITVEPKLPRDLAEDIASALAVTQRRGPDDIPLMSKATARETHLMIRDPDAEEAKVLAEMGKGLPPIMAAEIAKALKKQGEDDLAEEVTALLRPGAMSGGGGAAPGGQPQGGAPQLDPRVIEAVVQALMQSGQPELAEALLQGLGISAPGGQPGAEAVAPGPNGTGSL